MARHTVTLGPAVGAQVITLPATFAGGFQFDVRGQAGQTVGAGFSGVGGFGGRVTGSYAPAVGDTISAYVAGLLGSTYTGYHLGGAGAGSNGGGSTAILDGATLIAEAGGGGGCGMNPPNNVPTGGTGGIGGASPGNGGPGVLYHTTTAAGGGHGGTGSGGAGGAGGTGNANGVAGSPGTVGGAAGTANGGAYGGGAAGVGGIGGGPGGGGGGGSIGGGGGGGGGAMTSGFAGSGGAGGGGASSSAGTSVVYFDGYQGGNGAAILSWQTEPTVTATGPTGTYSTNSTPPLTAAYASADGAPMQAYRVMVYPDPGATRGAVGDAPDLPLAGVSPLFDTGVVYATGSTLAVAPPPLVNGALVAYFSVLDAAGADSEWSAWAWTNWSQAAPAPSLPAVTLTAQVAQAQVAVTLTPSAPNALDAATATLESGLGSWSSPQANVNVARSSAPAPAHGGSWVLWVEQLAAVPIEQVQARTAFGNPITPNAFWQASAWFYFIAGGGWDGSSGTTTPWMTVTINWFTSGGALISSLTSTGVKGPFHQWFQVSAAGISPATAAFAQVVVGTQFTGGQVDFSYYVDDVSLNLTAPTYYVVQRSTDGVTWQTCQGGGQVTGGVVPVTFNDHGAPREVTLSYRVQGVAVFQGNLAVSAWTAPVTTYLASDGHDWLMCAANPTLDTAINYKGPDNGALSHEDQVAYYPEGRVEAVVFHGTIHAEAFTLGLGSNMMTFLFATDADWADFTAMRMTQQPLLLKTVYGDTAALEQFWIVLGPDMSTLRYGGGSRQFASAGRGPQLRAVTCAAIQVAEPA